MSSSFLLQGGCVLTLGPKTSNHASADVLIEDDVVTEIGTGLRSRSAEVIDATNTIVMPGFVDTHRRCWPSLFKNEGTSIPILDLDPSPDDVYAGTLTSLVGAVAAGITTVVDWYDGPDSPDHVDAVLRAHAESGVRTVLVLALDRWAEIARHIGEPPSTTTLAVGSTLAGGDIDAATTQWRAARESGLRIHTIGDPSSRDAFARLGKAGLLGPDVTVAHGTGLSDADLDAISEAESGVALTPSSDMTIGPGAPPMQAFLDRGIRPGLGVDDEQIGPGDILAQMRAAISIQHATYFDLKLAGKGGLPNLLSTRDVIKYSTIDGARTVGAAATTGSIEVGKQADIIVLRTDRPNIHPVNDPIGAVVWGMDTSNLDWVFVAGHPLMQGGDLKADFARLRELGASARERMGSGGPRVSEVSGGVA